MAPKHGFTLEVRGRPTHFFALITVLVPLAALAQVSTGKPAYAAFVRHKQQKVSGEATDTSLFLPVVTYDSGGTYAYSVAVGDVNGDGKPDLLVTNCGPGVLCGGGINGVVGVLRGNGDGTFAAAVTYDTGGFGTASVAVADVNGDGKADLIVANSYFSNTIGVLLGNGDGSFQPVTTYSSGGGDPGSVAVADVNGDGKPDVLVANSSSCYGCSDSGLVGVLLGNGDGTFQPAVTYNSGGYNFFNGA